MTHGKYFLILILLTMNLLACKNEPAGEGAAADQPISTDVQQKRDSLAGDPSQTTQVEAPASAKKISSMNSERMLLQDATEVPLPKFDDKSSITLFFATPGSKSPESTALSAEGLMQSTRLARQMASLGLSAVWVEGNTGMQTGLPVAKDNKSELNMLDPNKAGEILKTIVQDNMGKRILIIASPSVLSQLTAQVAGKKVVDVPTAYSPVLYFAKVRAIGDADFMELSY
jgi:hypothetical protein